jgi:hypothetical protein
MVRNGHLDLTFLGALVRMCAGTMPPALQKLGVNYGTAVSELYNSNSGPGIAYVSLIVEYLK